MKNKITERKSINSILRFYSEATDNEIEDGKQWYFNANDWASELSKNTNSGLSSVVGILAALSPACSWEVNKRNTTDFILWKQGLISRPKLSTYGQFVNKATAIWEGGEPEKVLNGKKITAFYHNILNPHAEEKVCIDRHAYKVATGSLKGGGVRITPKQYEIIQEAYRRTAETIGLIPNQIQAITWVTYKRIVGR